MNSRERLVGTLTGKKVDRVPFIVLFGGENAVVPAWEIKEPGLSAKIDKMLKFEGAGRGWVDPWINTFLCGTPPDVVVEEDEEKKVIRTGSGSLVMSTKHGDFHSRTLEYAVKDRKDWLNIKAKFMDPNDQRRFPKDWAERCKAYNRRDYALQLGIMGVYNTSRMLMGDEALLMAFYDDPDMVHDMMSTITDLAVSVWEKMCKGIHQFDLIESWEAMAYKGGCLISPETFREFIKPNYQRIVEFGKAHKIELFLGDTHGDLKDLAGLFLESGFNAMYPFEIQAGNDMDKLMDKYPKLGMIGGLDKNCMSKGKKEIDVQIEKARRLLKRKGRYIPGPDYFPLSDVPFENYKYFMEQLREVILTTK